MKKNKIGENTKIREYVILRENIEIGCNCHIGNFSLIRNHSRIGDNTSIGSFVVVEWGAKIGNSTIINGHSIISECSNVGNNVFIGPGFCNPADNSMGNIFGANYVPTPAIIEDYVKIGANVTLLPGITIGKGAVIGAGSLVTKDVPMGETWVGNPARKLK